ncbi:MAG: antirestriction protein ArdA [Pseudomonadota bacterium]
MTTTPQIDAPLDAPTASVCPRIYVACLAACNAGCLHGRWIESTTPDEIRAEVRATLGDRS